MREAEELIRPEHRTAIGVSLLKCRLRSVDTPYTLYIYRLHTLIYILLTVLSRSLYKIGGKILI